MLRTTSHDGTPIGWQKSGRGPALLLVHGTTADHTRWAPILPGLSAEFTTHAMDRRGRGLSGDAAEYHMLREAEDVAAVVEAIGEEVVVMGHSYGAVCCLEAARMTKGISRLVLYEPPVPTGLALYPPGLPDRMQALIGQGESEAALEVFFREVVRMPAAEFEAYRRLPVWQTRVSLAGSIPRELAIDKIYRFDAHGFADLRIPTLLLLGGDSPSFFSQAIAVIHDALPNSEVLTLPGQQHIAMDTNPDLFLSAVLPFLRGQTGKPGMDET